MKTNYSRKEKIKILQAVKGGKLNPASLQPPRVYVFIECSDKPGIYEHKGKEYNEIEFREFCNRIEDKKNRSLAFAGLQYPHEDTVIKFCKHSPGEPEPGFKNITLDLSK